VLFDQLEKVFMVIGDKVLMASGGKSIDDYDIKDDNVTSELVVRPRPEPPAAPMETRNSLNNMTKQMICDKCVERYGVELNFRTEKKHLITEFLAIQETEK